MDHTPPPFFKRGPAPLVRLFFFASLSLALLVIDARFRYVEGLRSWLALAAYPLQRAATAPIDIAMRVGEYFSTQASLLEENERLRSRAAANAQDAQRYRAAEAEAAELRRLIGAGEKLPVRATQAEVLYLSTDPYAHKLFIDRGRYVLVLTSDVLRPPRPDEVQAGKERRPDKSRRARIKEKQADDSQ